MEQTTMMYLIDRLWGMAKKIALIAFGYTIIMLGGMGAFGGIGALLVSLVYGPAYMYDRLLDHPPCYYMWWGMGDIKCKPGLDIPMYLRAERDNLDPAMVIDIKVYHYRQETKYATDLS